MPPDIEDPRMHAPQCDALQPVSTVHTNKWFQLMNRGGYYTIEPPQPQVIVLPVVEDHSIVMIKAKRPVLADSPLELPAGAAQPHERPLAAAGRELREETGIAVSAPERYTLLPPISISPNRHPILPWIYEVFISQAEYDDRSHHDDEVSGVVCLPFEEVKTRMITGQIYISLPMAIISRFLFSKTYG